MARTTLNLCRDCLVNVGADPKAVGGELHKFKCDVCKEEQNTDMELVSERLEILTKVLELFQKKPS